MSSVASELSVAILVGGLGTRLRLVVSDRPKVLAVVHGRPFLSFLLDQIAQSSVDEVVLLAGHGAEQLRDVMGDAHDGVRLVYSTENVPLGTAGALRQALPLLRTPNVLLLNGDSYCDIDLSAPCRWHGARRGRASLVLTRVPDTARFGRVEVDTAGRVKEFVEKGTSAGPGWINAGIYLFDRSLLATLPAGRALSLERDVLPGWVEGGLVHGYRSHGRFLDIGTPASYAEAEEFFADFTPVSDASQKRAIAHGLAEHRES